MFRFFWQYLRHPFHSCFPFSSTVIILLENPVLTHSGIKTKMSFSLQKEAWGVYVYLIENYSDVPLKQQTDLKLYIYLSIKR